MNTLRPSRTDRGIALVITLVAIAAATAVLAYLFQISSRTKGISIFSKTQNVAGNRAKTGHDYSIISTATCLDGMKKTFQVEDDDGNVIPENEGGELLLAQQVYAGGVNGDPYGLDDGDSIDLVYLFNHYYAGGQDCLNMFPAYANECPVWGRPCCTGSSTHYWQKVLGETRLDDYLHYQFKTNQTDHPHADPFALGSIIAADRGVGPATDMIIHYRYVMAAVGGGTKGKSPAPPTQEQLLALLPPLNTGYEVSEIDFSALANYNYDRNMACYDVDNATREYVEEGNLKVTSGKFSVQLFGRDEALKLQEYLKYYPPFETVWPGPDHFRNPYDFKEKFADERMYMSRWGGISVINRETADVVSIEVPGAGDLGTMSFCDATGNILCVPIVNTCDGDPAGCTPTAGVDGGEYAVINIDETSPSYGQVSIKEPPAGFTGGRNGAYKDGYYVIPGEKGIGIVDVSTGTYTNFDGPLSADVTKCTHVTTSRDENDPYLYVGCDRPWPQPAEFHKIDPGNLNPAEPPLFSGTAEEGFVYGLSIVNYNGNITALVCEDTCSLNLFDVNTAALTSVAVPTQPINRPLPNSQDGKVVLVERNDPLPGLDKYIEHYKVKYETPYYGWGNHYEPPHHEKYSNPWYLANEGEISIKNWGGKKYLYPSTKRTSTKAVKCKDLLP